MKKLLILIFTFIAVCITFILYAITIANKQSMKNEEKLKLEMQVQSITTKLNEKSIKLDINRFTSTLIPTPIDQKLGEKLEKARWDPAPNIGLVKGSYKYGEVDYDNGYIATIRLVEDEEKNIIDIEFDEFAPSNYYEPRFQKVSKRYSDYGLFQILSLRTDGHNQVLVNSFVDAEASLKRSNLISEVDTQTGASNSLKKAILPKVVEMRGHGSNLRYYGNTVFKDGVYSRLYVVTEGAKIVSANYDEIFASEPSEIQNNEYRQFYRQSKYHSVDFEQITGEKFKVYADDIVNTLVNSDDLLSIDAGKSVVHERTLELAKEIEYKIGNK